MYQTDKKTGGEEEFGGFGRTIQIEDPGSHKHCQADERRIHPIVEPAPNLLVRVAVPLTTPGRSRHLASCGA